MQHPPNHCPNCGHCIQCSKPDSTSRYWCPSCGTGNVLAPPVFTLRLVTTFPLPPVNLLSHEERPSFLSEEESEKQFWKLE